MSWIYSQQISIPNIEYYDNVDISTGEIIDGGKNVLNQLEFIAYMPYLDEANQAIIIKNNEVLSKIGLEEYSKQNINLDFEVDNKNKKIIEINDISDKEKNNEKINKLKNLELLLFIVLLIAIIVLVILIKKEGGK
jgi:hypothetical protein